MTKWYLPQERFKVKEKNQSYNYHIKKVKKKNHMRMSKFTGQNLFIKKIKKKNHMRMSKCTGQNLFMSIHNRNFQ